MFRLVRPLTSGTVVPRIALIVISGLSMSVPLAAVEVQPFTGDVPLMIEEAGDAGVHHEYAGPWEFFVGGGVAVFDCNGDRKPELFFAGGENESALYINQSNPGGELRFKRASSSSNTRIKKVTGAYPLDIDNDGLMDLAILRAGRNRLLRGLGDCRFDANHPAFAIPAEQSWTTAFAATFESDNYAPTLVFGNYVDRIAPGSPWGTCDNHQLYRPVSSTSGDFAYSEQMDLSPGHCALSLMFTDWNRTGSPSLRVTNDRHYHRGGEEQLWHFDSGAHPRLYSRNDGWQQLVIWGMGIAAADLNADGFPEYALTSMGDTKIQTLDLDAFEENGWPRYRDIAFERNATAHRPYVGEDLKPSTGWHAEFDDINNDGWLDLFIAKGNVEQMQDFANFDPDNLLLGSPSGKFYEVGHDAGIDLPTRGRGGAVVDLNLDGQLDLVVVNRQANVSLFRNAGARADLDSSDEGSSVSTRATGNWLQIELQQDGKNRNAIGATLAIKSGNETRMRSVQVGGGHASGAAGFIHVGLGVSERAQIRVRWPDGQWSAPYRAFANNFLLLDRNSSKPRYWYPH